MPQLHPACHALRSLTGLASDIRFALRSLRRRPAFAATIVLTLALGVGATTAIFSVVEGVLLKPLPYRDPGQLVTIYTVFPQWRGKPVVGAIWNTLQTPYPDYVRYRGAQRTLADVAGFHVGNMSLTRGEETVSTTVAEATPNQNGPRINAGRHGRVERQS